MTDPERASRHGRIDTLLPDVTVAAKLALLAGLAGELFAAIVMSYVDDTRQYQALAAGVALGALAALLVTLRHRRNEDS